MVAPSITCGSSELNVTWVWTISIARGSQVVIVCNVVHSCCFQVKIKVPKRRLLQVHYTLGSFSLELGQFDILTNLLMSVVLLFIKQKRGSIPGNAQVPLLCKRGLSSSKRTGICLRVLSTRVVDTQVGAHLLWGTKILSLFLLISKSLCMLIVVILRRLDFQIREGLCSIYLQQTIMALLNKIKLISLILIVCSWRFLRCICLEFGSLCYIVLNLLVVDLVFTCFDPGKLLFDNVLRPSVIHA